MTRFSEVRVCFEQNAIVKNYFNGVDARLVTRFLEIKFDSREYCNEMPRVE